MPLLDEIIAWTSGLRPWQQEALRRIFAQLELSRADIDTILQMVREQEGDGMAVAGSRPFSLDDVPGAGSGATVRLVGVSGLDQVNGFPSGRAFDVAPDGMTILFGHNGAGKSGYARVLKNACKARHRVEVLPNAFEAATPPRPPSAEFTILVDGTPDKVRWVQSGPTHPHLSSVSVYDVACAHDYIDAEGTPAFQPYGLTHLTRLVLLQRDLQTRIAAERTALVLDTRQFEPLKGDTEVGRYIANLGAGSDRAILARLGAVSDEELRRLEFLKRTLLETDPAPRALALERLATRLDQAQGRAAVVQRWVNDRAIARAKELIEAEKATQLAMQLTQARLHGSDVQDGSDTPATGTLAATLLEGTGNAVWQTMYRAAEAFSRQTAYPEHPFPHLESDAHCVLCQQPYSANAAERMRRFAAFVSDSATADAQAAKAARLEALGKVQAVDLSLLDAPTLAEVAERLPDLHAAVTTAESVWTVRHTWVTQALQAGNWAPESALLPPEANLVSTFADRAASLRADANTLRTSADPAVRLALTRELAELEARQRLSGQLTAVERFIQDSQVHDKLNRCHGALNPQAVSRKLTALAATHVTEALADTMNAELKALGYKRRVQPDLTGRTDLGVTKVTLRLKDITAKASKVLSEGEQRALGLALFLAELESLPHTSTVVFDDPSTSLDHVYRRAIARRLVALSGSRQVLVLTHDAVFLTELAMALQRAERSANYKTISWDDSPGLVSEGLTWTTMDTKARLNDLRARTKALNADTSEYPADEIERQISAGYTSLRGTIERAIREVFLNNTVQPFSDVVSVDSFGVVVGHPQDEWEALQAAYARACEATEAHDTPGERQLPLPPREDLLRDIALVMDLVDRATARRKAYETQRGERTTQRKKVFGS
ncbi:AAA family ATPase [Pseudomonas sp. D(2018)]|uniref:AAA family ATPase n=1 Tax=Pseudomonas sp. D(2018) TaxID=2502238 RepID=UPI0010FA520C|nr:AAA family ATPase [Pseudomonas sp. D(2018)]